MTDGGESAFGGIQTNFGDPPEIVGRIRNGLGPSSGHLGEKGLPPSGMANKSGKIGSGGGVLVVFAVFSRRILSRQRVHLHGVQRAKQWLPPDRVHLGEPRLQCGKFGPRPLLLLQQPGRKRHLIFTWNLKNRYFWRPPFWVPC